MTVQIKMIDDQCFYTPAWQIDSKPQLSNTGFASPFPLCNYANSFKSTVLNTCLRNNEIYLLIKFKCQNPISQYRGSRVRPHFHGLPGGKSMVESDLYPTALFVSITHRVIWSISMNILFRTLRINEIQIYFVNKCRRPAGERV